MKKLNIAEILKDCPKGMELYSPLCGNCKLYDVNDYGIRIETPNKDTLISLYHDGRYCVNGEIMLFPKGKTTWEGFQIPFKDGDVVVCEEGGIPLQIFILKSYLNNNKGYCYTGYDLKSNKFFKAGNWYFDRLATEEEKQKLFDAIKDNGYKWNDKTKTLEKLVKLKFKIGDKIKSKVDHVVYTIKDIKENIYIIEELKNKFSCDMPFSEEKNCELVFNKFDIASLKAFESRVLVRDKNTDEWRGQFFSHYYNCFNRPYICIGVEGLSEYNQCIPYEGNEHLLGTTDDCSEYYKTWK